MVGLGSFHHASGAGSPKFPWFIDGGAFAGNIVRGILLGIGCSDGAMAGSPFLMVAISLCIIGIGYRSD